MYRRFQRSPSLGLNCLRGPIREVYCTSGVSWEVVLRGAAWTGFLLDDKFSIKDDEPR